MKMIFKNLTTTGEISLSMLPHAPHHSTQNETRSMSSDHHDTMCQTGVRGVVDI